MAARRMLRTLCHSPIRRVSRNTRLRLSAAAVVDMIRKKANWSAEDNWNIPGIYFADYEALVYDVSAAYKPSPKCGWTVKRQKEEAAAAALAEAAVADSTEEVDE